MNADGAFNNGTNFPFELSMAYSASGNIEEKNLSVSTLLNGYSNSKSYENAYSYISGTHKATAINSVDNSISLGWDDNGNLTSYTSSNPSLSRKLCWDEENRLTSVKDNNYLRSYIYNAGGE